MAQARPARARIRAGLSVATWRWRLLTIERRWALAPSAVALGRAMGSIGLVVVPVWIAYDAFAGAGPLDLPLLGVLGALVVGLLVAPARWLNGFTVGLAVLLTIGLQAASSASTGTAHGITGAWFLAIVLLVAIFVTPRVAVLVSLLSTTGVAVAMYASEGLRAEEYANLVSVGSLALLVALSVSMLASRQRRSLRRLERRLVRVHRAVAARREEANLDPLTGVANRRRFDLDLGAALADRRVVGNVVLVFADLDGLKAINDEHGHPAGDQVLRAVAGALCGSVRDSDAVYRIGGDEFAALLVGAEPSGIRKRLGDTVTAQVLGLGQVRASLGIAAARAGDSPLDLIARADQALYRVKRAREAARLLETARPA